jgi:mRNA interferase RelE/StbE
LVLTNGAPMQFNLIYHPDVKKVDLPKIDSKNAAMIRRAIEERLAVRPEIFGRPLRGTLRGYWKLRVGDYRIVFKLSGTDILILAIIDRKTVC